MLIRDIPIKAGLILAPMEGVTDLTFRRLIRSIGGCGLTVTEFIAAEALRRKVARVEMMARFDPDERPVAIQIYGRRPQSMAEAARIVQDSGASILDLNMGCPSKKVCAHSGGSALMKEPEVARSIIAAMRAAVSIPFTVKMRSGWDQQHKNALEIATLCQEEGVDGVAIHWRTRTDKYGGERELDTIAAVKAKLRIPVVANGDIVDVSSALETLKYTGCDGLMIGRGAVRNPWIFKQIEQVLAGQEPIVVDHAERKRVLLGYFEAIRPEFRSDKAALGRMKKISNFFTRGVPYGGRLRQAIFHSQTIAEATERVEEFFENLSVLESGVRNPFHDGSEFEMVG